MRLLKHVVRTRLHSSFPWLAIDDDVQQGRYCGNNVALSIMKSVLV
jgi:hypothetical protein